MLRLARLERRLLTTVGIAVVSGSCEVRRQGAKVRADQNKTTGQAIDVEDVGTLTASTDTVEIWRGGTTLVSSSNGASSFNVSAVSLTARTVTLTWADGGTLALSDNDRISPTNNLITLYSDPERTQTTPNPLTSSNTGYVTAWMTRGHFDRKVSGTNLAAQLIEDDFVGGPDVFDTNSARYRAIGDGTTDNTDFFLRAMDEAYEDGVEGQGGVITTEPGIYMVSDTVIMPGSRLIWRGSGDRSTIIRSTTGFSFNGTTDAVVQVGNGANTYSRIENMQIDCNNVANSIAYYSADIQENGGARDVIFTRYQTKGVFVGGTFSAQNYLFRNCNFAPSVTGANTAISMDLNGAGRPEISGCTFNPYDGTTLQAGPAIRIGNVGNGGIWDIGNLNIEDHTSGIQTVGTSTGGTIINVGSTNVATVVTVAGPGWYFLNVPGQIADNSSGGNGTFTMNSGFYFLSNNGGAGLKTILSCDGDAASRMNSAFTFLKGITLGTAGDLNVGSAVDLIIGKRIESHAQETVASAATISVATNVVRLTGNTTINTINIDGSAPGASHIGYELELYATTDAISLGTSGNIIAARTIGLDAGLRLRWDNSSSPAKWRPTDTPEATVYSGRQHFGSPGATITLNASVGLVTLDSGGNPTVSLIAAAASYVGKTVLFSNTTGGGTLTFADGGAAGVANEILSSTAANITLTVGESVALASDGTNWIQTSPVFVSV